MYFACLHPSIHPPINYQQMILHPPPYHLLEDFLNNTQIKKSPGMMFGLLWAMGAINSGKLVGVWIKWSSRSILDRRPLASVFSFLATIGILFWPRKFHWSLSYHHDIWRLRCMCMKRVVTLKMLLKLVLPIEGLQTSYLEFVNKFNGLSNLVDFMDTWKCINLDMNEGVLKYLYPCRFHADTHCRN